MWVAIEACTLSSAPLLYFNQNPRSLEATWKYLLIGSVGIALALLGSYFLAYSALRGGMSTSLFFRDLVREAPHLSHPWLRSAFILLFVGYGTKMGLAPMHSWKPDAYGEAPGLVGALLAGGLTTAAFLAVLRFFQICNAAHDVAFARSMMVTIGLFSMAVAAVFMVRQRDYKRMLAYSSVEHMGILVLGIGIGGAGIFGSLLHVINNGLTKGVLFLAAANIHRCLWQQTCRGRQRRHSSPAHHRRALPGRLFRHHGLAALRPLLQRVHHPARGRRGRALLGRGALPGHAVRGVRGHERDRVCRGARRALGKSEPPVATRTPSSPSPPSSCSWAWCCCSACTYRRHVSRALHEAAAFIEMKP
jgi:hypothetical protein